MKRAIRWGSVAALVAATLPGVAVADTIKLAGATTVLDVVVKPHRAAVEKSTGHSLVINANATGRGLVDLADGRAEAAMVSEPMDIALAAAELAGKKIDPSRLQMHELRRDEIVFVVHASNPVKKLSWEQLAAIHTGKVNNWKQVGGKDQPIVVYSDALTGGTRAMVRKVVMNGADYAGTVKSLTAVARVADLVSDNEAGIGALGRGFTAGKSGIHVVETARLERPLAFVTIGEPQPKVKQAIDAFRAAAGTPK